MIVDIIYPSKISGNQLDDLLANGWFRSGNSMHRSKIICLENDVCDVINIRMDAEKHQFSKSQRKLLAKNKTRFKVKIGRAKVTQEKDELYQKSKSRFKGFLMHDLAYFLTFGLQNSIFDTKEICVYDGEKLVALSYFDLGKKAISSQLGLLDWDYSKYSLGIYTMLLEIEYAKSINCKFYYPGHIVSQFDYFDYKLKLGAFKYLANTNRWRILKDKDKIESLVLDLKQKSEDICVAFIKAGFKPKKFSYPLFSLAYTFDNNSMPEFLSTSMFVCAQRSRKAIFKAVYYNIDNQLFEVAIVKELNPQIFNINPFTESMKNSKQAYKYLLKIEGDIEQFENLSDLTKSFKAL